MLSTVPCPLTDDEVDVAARWIRANVSAQLDATQLRHGPVAYHDVGSVGENGIPCSGAVVDDAVPCPSIRTAVSVMRREADPSSTTRPSRLCTPGEQGAAYPPEFQSDRLQRFHPSREVAPAPSLASAPHRRLSSVAPKCRSIRTECGRTS